MPQRLIRLVRERPLLSLAFGLSLVVTLFFGGRFVLHGMHWNASEYRDQPIMGWMTPGYVGRSWHVPKDQMEQILGRADPDRRRQTLEDIASDRGIPTADLIAQVQIAIDALRARQP